MAHTFLMEPGRWILTGHWLERGQSPQPVNGKLLVGWGEENWFSLASKLSFPGSDRPEIIQTLKGRLDYDGRRFSFLIQHSELGNVEGEGWVTPAALIQRYWVVDDKKMRTGFVTWHRQSAHQYGLSQGMVTGSFLTATLDGTLQRQGV